MTRILRSQTAAAAKHASGAPIKTLGNLIKIDNEMQTALTRNDACPPKLWRRRIEPSSSIQRSKKYKPMIDSASDCSTNGSNGHVESPSEAPSPPTVEELLAVSPGPEREGCRGEHQQVEHP